MKIIPVLTATLALAASIPAALAQSFPSKPIRMVVPFSPGGTTDIIARQLAARLAESFGQPVTVDNRAGAGGNIGAELVAKSPADGYTVLLTTNSIAVNVSLYPKLGYNLLADFQPLAFLASAPLTLLTHPLVPAKSVKELVALSKKHKGGLNLGSNGTGTTSHLSGELFRFSAGIDLTHIPYKGGTPHLTALLSGEVDIGFLSTVMAVPHVRAGKLRALAVTTARPSAALPGVPAMASFFPDFDTDIWWGAWLPAGVPKPVLERWVEEVRKAHGHPDVRAAFERDGADVIFLGPTEFLAFLKKEIAKYADLVRRSGAKPTD
jgi:tripartite-type tricarboxylate transporter receptor subunit TctC